MRTTPFMDHRFDPSTRQLDLRSAFNDGYELSPRPLTTALLQWALVAWGLVALTVGSFWLAESLFNMMSAAVAYLRA